MIKRLLHPIACFVAIFVYLLAALVNAIGCPNLAETLCRAIDKVADSLS